MTRAFFSGTQQSANDNDGRPLYTPGGGSAPVWSVSDTAVVADVAAAAAKVTTVAANVATLVSDGASPTQAHVNTLNTDWGTLDTDWGTLATDWGTLATAIAALAAETGDFYFSYDTSKITTLNALNTALDSIRRQALSAGFK